jgi:cyclic pyranopterin phosphate synthase
MPPDGVTWQPHETMLRYEEIAEIVKVAAENGITDIRLTGGDPLVRGDICKLITMIRAVPQIKDISLTTNGLLLGKYAQELKESGLTRVNVSLDTLDAEKFSRLTRGGSFEKTWSGILTADAAGLHPIKLNTVVIRGINDSEMIDLAKLSIEKPWNIRFIELMPVRNQAHWGEGFLSPEKAYVSVQEMQQILAPLKLKEEEIKNGNGPAHSFRIPGAVGTIGFISPIGEKFCADCNRLRLTADGNLRPCLLSEKEVPLREAIRAGKDILPLLQEAVQIKPQGHHLEEQISPSGRCMMQIGG